MLDQIIPFRYLSRQLRERLQQQMTACSYAAGETIVRQHDSEDDRIFLLLSGEVEAFDGDTLAGVIGAGNYFGERAALFGESRKVEIRAAEPVRALSMTGEQFLALLEESRPFAQGLGQILRLKQGIFVAFEQFMSELLRGVGQGAGRSAPTAAALQGAPPSPAPARQLPRARHRRPVLRREAPAGKRHKDVRLLYYRNPSDPLQRPRQALRVRSDRG